MSLLENDLIMSLWTVCIWTVHLKLIGHLSDLTIQSANMFYVKVGVFFGGMAIAKDEQVLKNNCPHIIVGTPGRILALVKSKKLSLKNLKHFVLDECDKMLEQLGKNVSRVLELQ